MTVEPFGICTGLPFTVTSITSLGAGCCWAAALVCRILSAVELQQGEIALQTRSDCAACGSRPSMVLAVQLDKILCLKAASAQNVLVHPLVMPRWISRLCPSTFLEGLEGLMKACIQIGRSNNGEGKQIRKHFSSAVGAFL